jgi:hypothetical protein
MGHKATLQSRRAISLCRGKALILSPFIWGEQGACFKTWVIP